MSCFRTWTPPTYRAIAMMTFSLSLRTTEAFCVLSPTPVTFWHVSSFTRNPTPPFPTPPRMNLAAGGGDGRGPVLHLRTRLLVSSFTNCGAERKGMKRQKASEPRQSTSQTVCAAMEKPHWLGLQRDKRMSFGRWHSMKYPGRSHQGKKRQQNYSKRPVSECPSNCVLPCILFGFFFPLRCGVCSTVFVLSLPCLHIWVRRNKDRISLAMPSD